MYGETFYGRHKAQHQLQWSQYLSEDGVIVKVSLLLWKVGSSGEGLALVKQVEAFPVISYWTLKCGTSVVVYCLCHCPLFCLSSTVLTNVEFFGTIKKAY